MIDICRRLLEGLLVGGLLDDGLGSGGLGSGRLFDVESESSSSSMMQNRSRLDVFVVVVFVMFFDDWERVIGGEVRVLACLLVPAEFDLERLVEIVGVGLVWFSSVGVVCCG